MARLFSSPSEVLAIKAICSKDRAISGYVLANIDDSYFHNDESQEAYATILKHMGKKGAPPAFGLLVEELGLSEDTREFLKLSGAAVKTQEQAEQLVDSLGSYRRTRLLYKLAKGILTRLQKDSVDVASLTEAVADKVARISAVRSTENTLFHVGKDSNISDLVEEILYGEDTSHVIPTGFKYYDGINGGFKRGALVLIGGSTGSGKSSFYGTEVYLSTLVLQLEGKYGEEVTMEAEPTDNILVRRNAEAVWVEAKDLTEDDEVVIDPEELEANLNRVSAQRST